MEPARLLHAVTRLTPTLHVALLLALLLAMAPRPLAAAPSRTQTPGAGGTLGVQAFLETQPGVLKSHREQDQTAATLIEGTSLYYGLSPHLLLALLETTGSLLSDPAPPQATLDQPFGTMGPGGFKAQLEWASQALRAGLGPHNTPPSVSFDDGTTISLDASRSAEELAVQLFLAIGRDADQWRALTARFDQVFQDIFGGDVTGLFTAPSLEEAPPADAPDSRNPAWGAGVPQGFLFQPWPAGTNVVHLAYFDHTYPTVDSGGAGDGAVLSFLGEASVQYDTHDGHDYLFPDLPIGTPILAAAPGIAYARTTRGNGVVILHDNGYETVYWHLDTFAPRFASLIDSPQGIWVDTGEVLGTSGATGFVIGTPHLHFEVRHYGRQVDPYGWFGTGPDPCPAFAGCAASTWLWHASLRGTYNFTPPGAALRHDPSTEDGSSPPPPPPPVATAPSELASSPPPDLPADAPPPDQPPLSPAQIPTGAEEPTSFTQIATLPDQPANALSATLALSETLLPTGTLSLNPPPDLLLQAGFDGHTVQAVGHGQPTLEGASVFPVGRYDQALGLDSFGGVTYPISGNLDAAQGTISLWAYVPSVFPPTENEQHYLFATSAHTDDPLGIYTGTLALHRDQLGPNESPRWVFWTTPNHDAANRNELTLADSLAPGWHHFAVSWDAEQRTKKLYLDGNLMASVRNVDLPHTLGDVLHLGRFAAGDVQSGMLLDDLAVFGHALTDHAVAALAAADLPLAPSASHTHSTTLLLDTNAQASGGGALSVQLGRAGQPGKVYAYYDAFTWELPPVEGTHVIEARYTDAVSRSAVVSRTITLDLPPRGQAAFEALTAMTATLTLSATDQHRPMLMQISAQPDFAGAPWQPLRNAVTWQWQAVPRAVSAAEQALYVRFQDANGQVSDTLRVVEPEPQRIYLPIVIR